MSALEMPTRLRIMRPLSSIGLSVVIRYPEAKPIADDPYKIWSKITRRHLVKTIVGKIRKP